MIDIKRRRNIEPTAQEWLRMIKKYFHDASRCYMVFADKSRHYFNSYAEKLKFQCKFAILGSTVDRDQKREWLGMLNQWWIQVDDIILASPSEMEVIVNDEAYKSLFEVISPTLVWYYVNLPPKFGYFIINELNIKTCPYCNRQFIHTFKGMRVERPELDHFNPKADYPIFCLSFYNLIPACHSCNHVKLENFIKVNPYKRAFKSKFTITDKNGRILSRSAIYKLTQKEMRLALNGMDEDEEKNDRVLGLTTVYNLHTDYVKELIDKSMAYDAHARNALIESFQGVGHHPRQVYDFVWGRHLMDAEYEDRPLSKLTADILDLLDIKRQ